MAGLRRLAVLLLVSIPVAGELVLGEALFVGHIVLLVEGLGFVWGLLVVIAIWAVLGVFILAFKDLAWPRLMPFIERLRGRGTDLLARGGAKALLSALAVLGVLGGIGAAVALAGDEIADWGIAHRADVALFLVVAVVGFGILLMVARLGRALESWVRRTAGTAGPAMRSFATLVTMVMLGPALGWLLFRLFGYSGRTTYALTLVSAPVFGAVWVPLYGLGVWGLIEGLF